MRAAPASEVGWRPALDFGETLDWTVDWYRGYFDGGDARERTLRQIAAYEERL